MTQDALAEKLGVTYQAVSKWENSLSCPDIVLLPLIADVFGVSIDSLFGRDLGATASSAVPEQGLELLPDEAKKNDMPKQAACAAVPGSDALPWQDDEALHIAVFRGRQLLTQTPESVEKIVVEVDGDSLAVNSQLSVSCGDVTGCVAAGGGVDCGDVSGSVQAGGNVDCGDVGGTVQAGGSVDCGDVGCSATVGLILNCGDVGQNASAGNEIHCGDVGGNVVAGHKTECGDIAGEVGAFPGGTVECGDVDGDVSAAATVCCGDVDGSAKAGGSITCGDVGGNASAGSNVTCGDIGGRASAGGRIIS